MKIIITEQQSNELLSSMLEDMFNGYEIKFEGDLRNIYVNGKLMAQLGPSSSVVSLDAFNELKDNLFFNSDKDLAMAFFVLSSLLLYLSASLRRLFMVSSN